MNLEIPPLSGSYALCLNLDRSVRELVGRLGEFDFPAGDYVYLGSAHGPGGLHARLKHHVMGAARPRWHIDYLRRLAVVRGIVYRVSNEDKLECSWTHSLIQSGGQCLVPGFGASDCTQGCAAHLVYISRVVRSKPGFEMKIGYNGDRSIVEDLFETVYSRLFDPGIGGGSSDWT